MTTNERNYVFDDAAKASELERLRAIESIFDPRTRELLLAAGVAGGTRCLEVGAGAGSIAVWLRGMAGAQGRVVAVDKNTRFLTGVDGIEVVEGDVQNTPLGKNAFDLAHARYVLIHNADSEGVLDAVLERVAPGGFVLFEEPDFSAARALAGPDAFRSAHEAVSRAILEMFTKHGMDPAFGVRLPRLLGERHLELVSVEHDAHVARGGSPLARMMGLSTRTLGDKYVATGAASPGQVLAHVEHAEDPSCWAIHYATVRVLARKP